MHYVYNNIFIFISDKITSICHTQYTNIHIFSFRTYLHIFYLMLEVNAIDKKNFYLKLVFKYAEL